MKNRLQEKRRQRGLTQPQLSAFLKQIEPRTDVGMVSRYEQGVCLPTREQLEALEAALQAPRTELYDADDLDLLDARTRALSPAERRFEARRKFRPLCAQKCCLCKRRRTA